MLRAIEVIRLVGVAREGVAVAIHEIHAVIVAEGWVGAARSAWPQLAIARRALQDSDEHTHLQLSLTMPSRFAVLAHALEEPKLVRERP